MHASLTRRLQMYFGCPKSERPQKRHSNKRGRLRNCLYSTLQHLVRQVLSHYAIYVCLRPDNGYTFKNLDTASLLHKEPPVVLISEPLESLPGRSYDHPHHPICGWIYWRPSFVSAVRVYTGVRVPTTTRCLDGQLADALATQVRWWMPTSQ